MTIAHASIQGHKGSLLTVCNFLILSSLPSEYCREKNHKLTNHISCGPHMISPQPPNLTCCYILEEVPLNAQL